GGRKRVAELGHKRGNFGMCWCGRQTVGSAPDDKWLHSVAKSDGCTMVALSSRKGNSWQLRERFWMLSARISTTTSHTVLRLILGPLETQAMEILWSCGECSVRELIRKLDRDIAYTTVMTTLDRLYKKKLVTRRRLGRANLYSPR